MSHVLEIVNGRAALATVALAACVAAVVAAPTTDSHTSARFQGIKANTGTVTHATRNGQHVLTLSDDFTTPDTPAPHWQLVDTHGNAYLCQRLIVKGDGGEKMNKSIVVPSYVPDIAKVQIWCAFAETLLGETTFSTPIVIRDPSTVAATSRFMGVKANSGTATHRYVNGQRMLTLSDDFKVPDAPAPHWQVVDSTGRTYLLQRLMIKSDRLNKTIVVPPYVKDIAKVQIWCAYAEVLLGEASFEQPVD